MSQQPPMRNPPAPSCASGPSLIVPQPRLDFEGRDHLETDSTLLLRWTAALCAAISYAAGMAWLIASQVDDRTLRASLLFASLAVGAVMTLAVRDVLRWWRRGDTPLPAGINPPPTDPRPPAPPAPPPKRP